MLTYVVYVLLLTAAENRPSRHDHGRHREYGGGYHGNNGRFVPAYRNHQGYYNNERDWRPNYGGAISSQSQANAQSTGIGSTANSKSSSQFLDNFSQSKAQAGSQEYQPISSYPPGSNGHSGASSSSSSASATSGIVNGVPVSSASSASAASSGDASSASSSASSSGGFVDRQGRQFSPWYFQGRIPDDDSDDDSDENDDHFEH